MIVHDIDFNGMVHEVDTNKKYKGSDCYLCSKTSDDIEISDEMRNNIKEIFAIDALQTTKHDFFKTKVEEV